MSSFRWKVFDNITQTMSYTNGLTYKDISHSCKYTINLNEYPAMYCDIQVEWDWSSNSSYTEALTTIQSTGLAILARGPDLFLGNRFLSNVPARWIEYSAPNYRVNSNSATYGMGFKHLERIQLPASGLENPILYLSGPAFRNMFSGKNFIAKFNIKRYTLQNV